MPEQSVGTLIGVGVGPGDPELITVKGVRALQRAAVVAFPAGVNGQPGTAETIVAPWLRSQQQPLPLEFPYVQDPTQLQRAWQRAADQVWQPLSQGQDVVFACEGDAGFYGTFTYLAQALMAQRPQAKVQAVPGVCSPVAAAAVLGLPLAVRSQQLAILPALYRVADLEAALDWAEVVVLMKVGSVYPQVWQILQRRRRLRHSAVVVHATRADQRLYRDLRAYPQLDLPYFSLLIVQADPDSLG